MRSSHGLPALHRLCHRAVDELGVEGACITINAAPGLELAAASSPEVEELEELQFVLGEGPTGDALALGQPVLTPDLGAEAARWVQFAPAAAERGVGGAYAFPLQVGGARLGVLTAYAAVGSSLSPTDVVTALDLAEAARDALLDSLDGHGADGVQGADGVARSLPLRTEVYQAQGILMAALDVSLTEALVRMRAMAFAEGLDLNQLAADLVSGRRPALLEDDDAR